MLSRSNFFLINFHLRLNSLNKYGILFNSGGQRSGLTVVKSQEFNSCGDFIMVQHA
jgi:hypothetical protein